MSNSLMHCRERQIVLGALFVALAITVSLYWPSLGGGFFFDDEPNIIYEPLIRIESLDVDSLRKGMSAGHAGPSGRPISQLSFALNFYFGGLDPFGFKATNLAIHLLCGLLVFALARRVMNAAWTSGSHWNNPLALWIAATWLLHPIQLLPVLHSVQRMTSLSALFLFTALLLHIRSRECNDSSRLGMALAWCVFWPLSFFSKENGALFPLFVLAWEMTIRRFVRIDTDRFAKTLIIFTILAFGFALTYLILPSGQWLLDGYEMRDFTLAERLLTEGRVLWFYIGLIALPRLDALGIYHDDISISRSLIDPWTTLPASLGLFALVWLAWHLRRRTPVVTFGIAWFFIGHSLESTVLPLELAHEHRNYVPLLGVFIASTAFLRSAVEAKGKHKTFAIALLAAPLLYLPLITGLRAHQFADTFRRTQIEAQHHRNSARAQYEAGRILSGVPDARLAETPAFSFARGHFERASEIDRNDKLGLLGLIHLFCLSGTPVTHDLIDNLTRRLRETPFAPGDRNILYAIKEFSIEGKLCLNRRQVDELFTAALTNPKAAVSARAKIYSWHADYLWLHEKDLAAARESLDKSLRLIPGNSSNQLKWAQLLILSGELENAKELLVTLRHAKLSREERITRDELLGSFGITERPSPLLR